MELQKLEMVTCPRCGRPFPLKRRELGYNYCINCSTEKHISYIIEGTLDGDGDDTVHDVLHIVSWEEAVRVNRIKEMQKPSRDIPDMRTIEEIEDFDCNVDDVSTEENSEE